MLLAPDTAYFTSQTEMGAVRCARLEELAFGYGQYHDSYIVTESRYEYFWGADDRGVIACVRRGRYLFGVGGPLAPAAEKRRLLADFSAFGERNGLVVSHFNVAADDAAIAAELGWEVTKFGEDAVISLRDASWSGARFEW